MPKTRDAFAFEKWLEEAHFYDDGTPLISIECSEMLAQGFSNSFDYKENKMVDFVDKNKEKKWLPALEVYEKFIIRKEFLYKEHNAILKSFRIQRHLKRLERFMLEVAVKIAEDSPKSHLKEMALRTRKFLASYRYLEDFFYEVANCYNKDSLQEIKKLRRNFLKKLGSQIQIARETAGYTGTKIAKYLGISQKSYSQYETGRAEPSLSTLLILSNRFNVSVDFFLGVSN